VERVASGLANVMKGATGILSPLGTIISFAHGHFQRMVNWARSGLRSVSRNMRSLLQRLVQFLGVVFEALQRLIAIAVNPFGIVGFLAGTIWRLIPECLKGPIIDFILDIIIRFLRAMPPMPTLGILWPIIKSAALGFLETVKGFTTARKVNVSNKMAKIVSGQSVSFAFGYLKGLALGVWDGITAPFQAIAAIFDLPEMIRNFLSNLGIRLCELIESIRCFAANLAGQVFGGLDSILSGLGELLEDPGKILDLIKCAIEGALAGARTIGATLAGKMMEFFEGADEAIGEALGRLTGSTLVQAVITYFSGGVGSAIPIIQKISGALRAVGQALGTVVRMLGRLLGQLVKFVKGLASKFAGAAARGARGVLGRLGGFFRKVAGWFGKLLRKIFKGVSRRLRPSPAQRRRWSAFKLAVRQALLGHPEGMTRSQVRGKFRGVLGSFRDVAKIPSYITKHGPNWRLKSRRVKSFLPRTVGHALLDARTRWNQGKKAVKKAIKALKRRPGNINSSMITAALARVKRKFKFKELSARFNESQNVFEIDGSMSPGRRMLRTPPERPTRNADPTGTPHQKLKVYPLVKRSAHRSEPRGAPPHWRQVERIKTKSGSSSLYIRGHVISGFFAGGGADNLTPIKRQANALMATGAETPVRLQLPRRAPASSRRPVYSYETTFSGAPRGSSPRRWVMGAGGRKVCQVVPAEQLLHKSVRFSITRYEYRESSMEWDREVPGPNPSTITNVDPYPEGEKCPRPRGRT
jgi:hypothetical protein